MNKLIKLFKLFKSVNFINGLRFGVAATTEHIPVLMSLNNVNTIIDIGANKGQFTLAARYVFSKSRIISFEPLFEPAETFRSLFKSDKNIFFTIVQSVLRKKLYPFMYLKEMILHPYYKLESNSQRFFQEQRNLILKMFR